MAVEFHSHTHYAKIPVDEKKAYELIESLIDSDSAVVFLLTFDEKVVGILAGTLTEMLFNKTLMTSEIMWWVEPEHRGRRSIDLLLYFEIWSVKKGAKFIQMVCLDDKVARLYERKGYAKREASFIKEF